MCFRRKDSYEKSVVSHELHKENITNCENLLVNLEDEATRKEVEEVLQLLKYKVGPSTAPEAKKIDGKIQDKLADIKVLLLKNKDDTLEKVHNELKNVKALIAERQVYSK